MTGCGEQDERREVDAATRERLIVELFDSSVVPMWASDEQHRIVLWNKGAERVYGFDARDVLGRVYLDVFISEEEREDSESDALAIIRDDRKFINYLAQDCGADGPKDVLTNCFRICDPRTKELFQAEVSVHIPEFNLRPAELEHARLRDAVRARRAEQEALVREQSALVLGSQRGITRSLAQQRRRLEKLVAAHGRRAADPGVELLRNRRDRSALIAAAAKSHAEFEESAKQIRDELDAVETGLRQASTAEALAELESRLEDVDRRIDSLED